MERSSHRVVDALADRNPLRGSSVPDVPRPNWGPPPRRLPLAAQVAAVQRKVELLEYNFLPRTFFDLRKRRPLRLILSTAQEIAAEALPIRCLEATFLALHLTQHMAALDRFPLAFKSTCRGRVYRHIVLGVRQGSCFGALGLSRKATLMDKPVTFPTLLALVAEYAARYAEAEHDLVSVKLGLFVSHDPCSRQEPFWRFLAAAVPRPAQRPASAEGWLAAWDGTRLRELMTAYEAMLPALSREYELSDAAPASVRSPARSRSQQPPDRSPSLRPRSAPRGHGSPHRSPQGPQGGQGPESPGGVVDDAGDGDDGADSDEDDLHYRAGCVLRGVSPFSAMEGARNLVVAGVASRRAAKLGPSGKEAKDPPEPKPDS